MTIAPDKRLEVDEDLVEPPVSREWARQRRREGRRAKPVDPPRRSGVPAARKRSRKLSGVYVLLTLLFVAALVGLGWAGYETSRDLRGGTSLGDVTDPTAPGYEATVRPTATHLLVLQGADGNVGDLVLTVEGAQGKGGAVLVIPGLTVVARGTGSNLSRVAELEGLPRMVSDVEAMLGMGVGEAVLLTPERTAQLFEAAGPLTIDNPDDLVSAGGSDPKVAYPAGKLTLEPGEVSDFLNFVGVGDADGNRPNRTQQVFERWLAAVASGGADAVPRLEGVDGITTDDPVDLGAVVAGLASGFVSYQPLPTRSLPWDGATIYVPDTERINALIPQIVPFPGSAFPGQRPRVKVLNGTTRQELGLRAAGPAVSAGGEVVILGNAGSLDVARTTVQYNDPSKAEFASRLAEMLGAEAVVSPGQTEAYDVTVIVGADFGG